MKKSPLLIVVLLLMSLIIIENAEAACPTLDVVIEKYGQTPEGRKMLIDGMKRKNPAMANQLAARIKTNQNVCPECLVGSKGEIVTISDLLQKVGKDTEGNINPEGINKIVSIFRSQKGTDAENIVLTEVKKLCPECKIDVAGGKVSVTLPSGEPTSIPKPEIKLGTSRPPKKDIYKELSKEKYLYENDADYRKRLRDQGVKSLDEHLKILIQNEAKNGNIGELGTEEISHLVKEISFEGRQSSLLKKYVTGSKNKVDVDALLKKNKGMKETLENLEKENIELNGEADNLKTVKSIWERTGGVEGDVDPVVTLSNKNTVRPISDGMTTGSGNIPEAQQNLINLQRETGGRVFGVNGGNEWFLLAEESTGTTSSGLSAYDGALHSKWWVNGDKGLAKAGESSAWTYAQPTVSEIENMAVIAERRRWDVFDAVDAIVAKIPKNSEFHDVSGMRRNLEIVFREEMAQGKTVSQIIRDHNKAVITAGVAGEDATLMAAGRSGQVFVPKCPVSGCVKNVVIYAE